MGTASPSTAIPVPDAVASSASAVASPPSVGSCMDVTPPVACAARASGTTLMPGACRKLAARSITSPATPAASSCGRASRASNDVPSMAIPLVRITRSPGRAPAVVTSSPFATSPSIVPEMIGRGRPSVISVWPPIMVTPSASHASESWSNIRSTSAGEMPTGSNAVARNHFGSAPQHATSFAFTWTAYQPIKSVAKVTGSLFATSNLSPKSIRAASSPTPGPTITRGSSRRIFASKRASSSGGSLPAGRPPLPPPAFTAGFLAANHGAYVHGT